MIRGAEISIAVLKELSEYIGEGDISGLTPLITLEDEQYINETVNEDGTITVEYTAAPIRFKDEAGNWAEIKTDLVTADDSQYDYETKSTEVKIQISKDIDKSSAFQVSYDKHSMEGLLPLPHKIPKPVLYNHQSHIYMTSLTVRLKRGMKMIPLRYAHTRPAVTC